LVARLTAHGDAHRAVVDRRLAEALLVLEARLDAVERRMQATGGGLDEPGSVPTQLAALRDQTLDRLARVDARLRQLTEMAGAQSVLGAPETVDHSAGYHEPPAEEAPGPDVTRSAPPQVIDTAASLDEFPDPSRNVHVS